jgi:hypothetical protein
MHNVDAEALSILMLQLNAKMNDSIWLVKEKGTREDFAAYRPLAAEVMGALFFVTEGIYAEHPQLRPEQFGGTYPVDPAIFKDRFYVPAVRDEV